MSKNIVLKFLRIVFFLDNPHSDAEKETNIDELSYDKSVGDNTKIHVDDETPDFFKAQIGEQTRLSPDVQLEETLSPENVQIVENTIGADEKLEGLDEDVANSNKKEGSAREDEHFAVEHSESLLDNKPLVKMFEECADVIKYVERIRPAFESDEVHDLINTVREQLVQAMVLSGGKTIDNENQFNILRHKCRKGNHATDGDIIVETIEPGVSLENRVFIKALVKVENEK